MNRTILVLFFAILATTSAICGAQQAILEREPLSPKNWASKLLDGDMVFIRSFSGNAEDIAALAGPIASTDPDKRFTHCGVVFKDKNGVWTVYEGKGREKQAPVSLKQWQLDEADGHPIQDVYVRRLADRSLVTVDALKKMKVRAYDLHHTSYDSAFMWTTDKFVYCSELIWKAYATGLGKNVLKQPHPIADYFKDLPKERVEGIIAKLKSKKAKKCWPKGKKDFDPEEKAITPEEIYDSAGLVSVTDDST